VFDMRKREFITLLGGAAAWPLAVRAQQPGKVHRVALVSATLPVSEMIDNWRPLVQGLAALGYMEGRNLELEWRSAEGKYERVPGIIRELRSLNVDVIVTGTSSLTQAVRDVTQHSLPSGRTPYLGRTCTGWIAPASPGARSGRDVRFIARPPHRTVRAAFPHTAPTSGV
jgi:hypothetical protein